MVYQGWLFVLLLVIVGSTGSDLRRKRYTQGYRPNNAASAKMYGESDERNKRSTDEDLGDYVDSEVISVFPALELPAGAMIERIEFVLRLKLQTAPSLAIDDATKSMNDDSTVESMQGPYEIEPDLLNENLFRGKFDNDFEASIKDKTKYSDCNNGNCNFLDSLAALVNPSRKR